MAMLGRAQSKKHLGTLSCCSIMETMKSFGLTELEKILCRSTLPELPGLQSLFNTLDDPWSQFAGEFLLGDEAQARV